MGARDDHLAGPETGWRDLRAAIVASDLDRTTSAGWTVKELVAHLAFWMEAEVPVLSMFVRGEAPPEGFEFGSGWSPRDEDWPAPDVHNAREAAWARTQAADTVLARADDAFDAMLDAYRGMTDDEATKLIALVPGDSQPDHFRQHLAELAG